MLSANAMLWRNMFFCLRILNAGQRLGISFWWKVMKLSTLQTIRKVPWNTFMPKNLSDRSAHRIQIWLKIFWRQLTHKVYSNYRQLQNIDSSRRAIVKLSNPFMARSCIEFEYVHIVLHCLLQTKEQSDMGNHKGKPLSRKTQNSVLLHNSKLSKIMIVFFSGCKTQNRVQNFEFRILYAAFLHQI